MRLAWAEVRRDIAKIPRELYGCIIMLLAAALAFFALFVAVPFAFSLATPSLIRNLPSRVADANDEFGRRVDAAFPIGSSVEEMTERLERSGFEHQGPSGGRWRLMSRDPNFVCALHYNVSWIPTEDNRIEDVEGSAGVTCF